MKCLFMKCVSACRFRKTVFLIWFAMSWPIFWSSVRWEMWRTDRVACFLDSRRAIDFLKGFVEDTKLGCVIWLVFTLGTSWREVWPRRLIAEEWNRICDGLSHKFLALLFKEPIQRWAVCFLSASCSASVVFRWPSLRHRFIHPTLVWSMFDIISMEMGSAKEQELQDRQHTVHENPLGFKECRAIERLCGCAVQVSASDFRLQTRKPSPEKPPRGLLKTLTMASTIRDDLFVSCLNALCERGEHKLGFTWMGTVY